MVWELPVYVCVVHVLVVSGWVVDGCSVPVVVTWLVVWWELPGEVCVVHILVVSGWAVDGCSVVVVVM